MSRMNLQEAAVVVAPAAGPARANLPPLEHIQELLFNDDLQMDIDNPAPNDGAAAAAAIVNHNDIGGESPENHPVAWVFGYGSLCWYPGFEFTKCITGYIRGHVRRFWQGNTTHRGTPETPGRVATLVEDKEGITWGCAYKLTGETALEYLKMRECTLGGYATLLTKFYPRVASYDSSFTGEAIEVLVYVALPGNPHWLGEDESERIAEEIATLRGPTGYNAEYILRLAKFMHEEIPDVIDEHLFDLEKLVLQVLSKRGIPVWYVMGVTPEKIRRDSHEDVKRTPTFEFTSRISEKKLRCLNI